MALRFLDSFDWETVLEDRYEAVANTAIFLQGSAIDGSTGMRWAGGSNAGAKHVQKLIGGGDTTWTIGAWLKVTDEPDGDGVTEWLQIREGATVHAEVRVVPTTASNYH